MKISLHFSDIINMENYFEYLKNKLHLEKVFVWPLQNEILRNLNVFLSLKRVKCFKLKGFISNLKYTRSWSGIRTATDGGIGLMFIRWMSDI